jgi:hypothetical protein
MCLGDYRAARTLQEESLVLRRELGDKLGIAYSLEEFAALALAQEWVKRAATLWGAAEVLRERIGTALPPRDRPEYDRSLAFAWRALGEEAFAAAWAEGRAMTSEQAIACALQGTDVS